MLWHNTSLQLQYNIYILNGLWSISGPPPNKPPTIDCKSFNIPHPPPSGKTEVEIIFGPFEGKDPEDGSIKYVNIYDIYILCESLQNIYSTYCSDKLSVVFDCSEVTFN